MVAGTISLRIRRSPGSERSKVGLYLKPVLSNEGIWIPSCSRPPIRVPIAIPTIAGCPKCGRIKARLVPPIREPRLKKLDAIAGTKKRPLVFKTPITTAESEIKMRKGSII